MISDKHTALPWSVDSIQNYGEYGDGPDTNSGFKSYAIYDPKGNLLFDTLNRDSAVSEIHEESSGDTFCAWDEPAERDLEYVVKCVNLHDDLAMMMRRLSYALKRAGTDDALCAQCLDFSKKHGLGGNIVRAE